MDWRNKTGLYGAYFLGMSGIGFTLPYLPKYLGLHGLSDRDIGLVSTLAAVAGLAQFPLGLWSDKVGRRKPFLLGVLALLAVATALLPFVDGGVLLWVLVVLFAENGLCRATLESLAGAEAAHLARPGEVGAALGALRFWRPVSIILVALGGGLIADHYGIEKILWPLAVLQALAVAAVLLIHNDMTGSGPGEEAAEAAADAGQRPAGGGGRGLKDPVLWVFVAAMVLFHMSNAPPGVYIGLFLSRELHASDHALSYLFVVSMAVWMLAVRPAGRLSDRLGRKPVLVVGWAAMTVRLVLLALVREPWQAVAVQVLDGLAQALFAVTAAAWVTDRLADPRRAGEAQVLVGSALVFGSAAGPLLSGLVVERVGYQGVFGILAGVGAAATAVVLFFVPETKPRAGSANKG